MDAIQIGRAKLEEAKLEADKAERQGEFARVAEIRYGEMVAIQQSIEEAETMLHQIPDGERMLKEVLMLGQSTRLSQNGQVYPSQK